MLAYAAHRRPARLLSPSTLMLIAGGHAALFAAVMAIRMDVIVPPEIIRTKIYPVEPDKPPPPEPKAKVEPKPTKSSITMPPRILVPTLPGGLIVDTVPMPIDFNANIGNATDSVPGLPIIEPLLQPLPQPAIRRVAARLLTPADRLRPPYPESKRRMEQEAVLRLRLAIGPDGRVMAVEPLGGADAEFLVAARAHLIKAWRYAPAREGDAAVASSLVITLRFELEE